MIGNSRNCSTAEIGVGLSDLPATMYFASSYAAVYTPLDASVASPLKFCDAQNPTWTGCSLPGLHRNL
jgi:hypothetical protein